MSNNSDVINKPQLHVQQYVAPWTLTTTKLSTDDGFTVRCPCTKPVKRRFTYFKSWRKVTREEIIDGWLYFVDRQRGKLKPLELKRYDLKMLLLRLMRESVRPYKFRGEDETERDGESYFVEVTTNHWHVSRWRWNAPDRSPNVKYRRLHDRVSENKPNEFTQ